MPQRVFQLLIQLTLGSSRHKGCACRACTALTVRCATAFQVKRSRTRARAASVLSLRCAGVASNTARIWRARSATSGSAQAEWPVCRWVCAVANW